jgi:ABC-2 type transport system permease protein
VNATLSSELVKLRTTRTTAGVLAALVGVCLVAIVLHVLGLPAGSIIDADDQRGVFVDVAANMAMVFGALVGALSITGEIRHGTIRPTVLGTPQRWAVIGAKTATSMAVGVACGLLAATAVAAAGGIGLTARGIDLTLDTGDITQLIAGSAVAAAAWATIGLGVGALARNQVAALVGLVLWILFVENVLLTGVPDVGRYTPGALGRALAGQPGDVVAAGPALALLAVEAAVVGAVGARSFVHHDIA